ncbi:DNA primase/helicase [Synechococcus phage S-SZBM1]|uniref:DNA primase/helicase n=1 Tax=Synechococcus phage S-SZBM1 TaxID=2926475 RepID=A0AC61TSN5_9CAUD|nr:DnaB-like replicative helicase [Synechococcus phage S-SZBM1]UNH61262.1 DNA primase/helicase [Synechococcus phage S-SZBM1]
MQKIEEIALSKLILDENYCRQVLPFLKDEYFDMLTNRILFGLVNDYVQEYNTIPEKTALKIEVEKRRDLSEEIIREIENFLDTRLDTQQYNEDWLMDTTEKWCKERAIYLALMESIKIADGQDKTRTKDAIPHIMSEALGTCFDDTVGHDYILDAENRYEFYHRKEDKVSFDLEYFNKITKGGLPNKTLNIALAGTGVGKSLFMCHMASACLLNGRNVLYITMEMAEEKIAERIDANLLDIPIQQLTDPLFTKAQFRNKIDLLNQKTQGRLVIKEYPTAGAHVGHFKSLLNELSMKRGFSPDIIFIDYLNICSSARYKNSIVNSYTFVKAIAEELRGLAVEYDVPVVSATQTTRSGYGSSDVELTDTSESFGLPATADLMFALISTEDLENMGQIMVKQLKNRYNDPTMHKRFILGIDRAKMRLYDCDQSAQDGIVDAGELDDEILEVKPNRSKFDSFKI